MRRNPVKTAALVGGAGFLIAGGPRRVLRFALGRVRPEVRDPHAGLLPDEIEKVLKDSGLADDPAIRRALDEDFADYLRRKGRLDPEPTASSVLWRTFDQLAGPLGTAGARILVQRLMSAEKERASARAAARAPARRRAGATRHADRRVRLEPGSSPTRPGWRNGRRGGLRSHWPQGRAGSTPVPGTIATSPRVPLTAVQHLAGVAAAADECEEASLYSIGIPSDPR